MLNTISLWRIPASSFKLTKIKIDEIYIHKKTNNELHIACLYNLPSYRCGILGYLFNLLFDKLPNTFVFSYYFEQLRWISDTQVICRSISYINRYIPFLNFGTWNRKQHFVNYNRNNSIFRYGGDNDESMSSIFNICSTDFYDSGCAILSNIPATTKKFVPFANESNRGILWSYFESAHILIITISTDKATYEQFEQLMSVQNALSREYPQATTYIIGDFKNDILFCEQMMKLLDFKFKIQTIDGLTKTTYLIHNYVFNVTQNDKILKPYNIVVSSPPPPTVVCKETRNVEIKEHIMEEEEEQMKVTPCPSPPPSHSPTSSVILSSPQEETTHFPYVIFNYFSSNKTPPKVPSPPSQSPPAQSPKSDDGWSKV